MKNKITVDLSCHNTQTGIIVKLNTGVIYTNQTGGVSCGHPIAEGFFIPLHESLEKDLDFLTNFSFSYTDDVKTVKENIDKTNEIFRINKMPFKVEVFEEMEEAWIPVVITNVETNRFNPFKNLEGMKGIITYNNSD